MMSPLSTMNTAPIITAALTSQIISVSGLASLVNGKNAQMHRPCENGSPSIGGPALAVSSSTSDDHTSLLKKATDKPSEKELNKVCTEVTKFKLAAHFYWGLWALIQASLSDIDFDYMGYAVKSCLNIIK